MNAPARIRPEVAGDWLYRPCPVPGESTQLVCFPHAGGDISAFGGLARAVDEHRSEERARSAAIGSTVVPALEVWVIRLPGRGGRTAVPMPARFDVLVADLVDGIAGWLRPGAVFYGQSLGALVAYEVARALPVRCRPRLVVPAGAPAPADWAASVTSPEHDAAALLRRCGLQDLLPAAGELRELSLATLRGDLLISRSYRHRREPRPDFGIHALVGHEDSLTPAALRRWAAATNGPFSSSEEDGGHLLASPMSCGPAQTLLQLHSEGIPDAHHCH